MSKSQYYITEGQVWHFGSITAPGQYDDFFLPLAVVDKTLASDIQEERHTLLRDYGNDNLEVSPAPFKVEGQRLILRLKWKHNHVDDGAVVVVDKDNNPLTATNAELQDAKLKLSFYQTFWEYKGKCGTKLVPRKIQLIEFGNLDSMVTDAFAETDAKADF
jgi:hypothetical protein